jgi:hypothetical protein
MGDREIWRRLLREVRAQKARLVEGSGRGLILRSLYSVVSAILAGF